MPAELIPLHPRFNPLSEKDHRHYEELLRRMNFSDAVVRHLARNLAELERQFVENDLVVLRGPRKGEPLDMEGRELVSTVARMSAHAKGAIPEDEFERIGAALFVSRCTTCHDESVVSRLLLYPEKERLPFLREKVGSMRTGFRTDQVAELARAIDLLSATAR